MEGMLLFLQHHIIGVVKPRDFRRSSYTNGTKSILCVPFRPLKRRPLKRRLKVCLENPNSSRNLLFMTVEADGGKKDPLRNKVTVQFLLRSSFRRSICSTGDRHRRARVRSASVFFLHQTRNRIWQSEASFTSVLQILTCYYLQAPTGALRVVLHWNR